MKLFLFVLHFLKLILLCTGWRLDSNLHDGRAEEILQGYEEDGQRNFAEATSKAEGEIKFELGTAS